LAYLDFLTNILRLSLPPSLALSVLLLGVLTSLPAQVPTGAVEGQVTDPSGAAVPGASVTVTGANGAVRTSATDMQGRYRVDGLAPAPYTVRIVYRGFVPFDRAGVEVVAGRVQTLNVRLQIQSEHANVTVSEAGSSEVGVDPSQNVGQIVLRGNDLDSFSDDPEDLANELQMLAGPSAGPEGAQIFIDGFSDGVMPPKASIREIRVNQNPFSAEYDRVGFGRVEVLTKPGSDKYHGQLSLDFGDRALTARNPYLTGPLVPNYLQEMFAGNFGGPLSKKASFFVDADYRITNENSLVNYTSLDSALNLIAISTAVVAPSRRFSVNPRVDYALTPNDTLTLRYSFVDTHAQNQGISTQAFDLASQAYTQDTQQQSAQVIESSVLGTNAVNDIRFQYLRNRTSQSGISTAPEVDVLGAFTGGGTFPLNYTDDNKFELQDNVTMVHGANTLKFGARLRNEGLQEQSTSNFNSRFIFTAVPGGDSALGVYQQNQLLAAQGLPQPEIAAMGFGPSEFLLTAGNPLANVNVFDAGVYVQDDWRVKPNMSLSAGLRYEGQSSVADHADLAPRLGFAWAPGGHNRKTVIRAGGGMFYDRFPANLGWGFGKRSISDILDPLRLPKRIGFCLVATCGLLLYGSKAEEYYYNPFFRIKAGLLVLAAVHAVVFRGSVYNNTAELDGAKRLPARAKLAAGLSLVIWTGIVCSGRAIGYISPGKSPHHYTSSIWSQTNSLASMCKALTFLQGRNLFRWINGD
jgi:hypothetical protein